MKLTNVYIPGKSSRLKFDEELANLEEEQSSMNSIEEEKQKSNVEFKGVYGWARYDQPYKNLIEKMGISGMTTSEILDQIRISFDDRPTKRRWSKTISPINEIMPNILSQTNAEIILLKICKGWSLKSLAAFYSKSITEINLIIRGFRKEIKSLRENCSANDRKRKRKVTELHIAELKDYLMSNEGKRTNLSQITSAVNQKLPGASVWKETVRRIMKEDLKKSFKRVSIIEKYYRSEPNIRKFLESAHLLNWFENMNYTMIFIDEFSLNSRQSKVSSWIDKGKRGYIELVTDKFWMSFVLAISESKFIGIQGVQGTFNSARFVGFIKQLIQHFEQESSYDLSKIVLVMDNAAIHVSSKMKDFAESHNVFIVTISPYSPWLNPWEKVIGAIKAKARSLKAHGR